MIGIGACPTAARYWLALVLLTPPLVGCSIDDLDLSGKACPCTGGWVCDTTRNQCIPEGSADAGTGGAGGAGGAGGQGGTSCDGQDDGTDCDGGQCYGGQCCSGCWDGVACQPGTELTHCGQAGALCQACGCSNDSCTEGACTPPDPVAHLSLGYEHSCAVLDGGTLWCWGRNQNGQLGLGDITAHSAPTQVGSNSTWALVAGGREHSCALRTDRSRWCWGRNQAGQLGLEDTVQRLEPTEASGELSQLTVGLAHSCGATSSRIISCWGSDSDGQLGIDGDGSSISTPTGLVGGEQWVMLSAGGRHSCAVRLDSTLWCWGYNIDGELGNGDFVDRSVPTQVGTEAKWVEVAGAGFHSCGRTSNDELWCWGGGLRGQLGIGQDGPNVNIPDPQRVGTESDWRRVIGGRSHACGLRGSGELWCWGANEGGQLGLAVLENHPSPTRIGQAGDWTDVAAGSAHSCGIRAGGGLWCWGDDQYGQVGSETGSLMTEPTRICLPAGG